MFHLPYILQRLSVGVGNERVSCARRMIPADTPSPCHSSPVFIGLPRFFFAIPNTQRRTVLEQRKPSTYCTNIEKKNTLIPSQLRWLNCLYLAGCPFLIFWMVSRQDQTRTLPAGNCHPSLPASFCPQKIWTSYTLIPGKHPENCSNQALPVLF